MFKYSKQFINYEFDNDISPDLDIFTGHFWNTKNRNLLRNKA